MSVSSKQPSYYLLDIKEVLHTLDSKPTGLMQTEAAKRLAHYGPNALAEIHKESFLHKYLRQFKDLMILLLIGSSIITFVSHDNRTTVVLLALVLFNTIIGFAQEYKAERLMESLEKLVVPEAKVMRGGALHQTASTDLVPGDIVFLEAGDSVPADLRLIREEELETNDFALTGESNPSRKFVHTIGAEVELASRHNLVFMGTTVANGEGHGVVIATGMQTELGRIASLSADTTADLSPLQKEMNHIASKVTLGTVLLCLLLLPIAINGGLAFKNALLFAIGIATSLIPQGLPAEINTALAQAANKLVKARALVKKLSAVETLGATNIICTDKTGTLTKNEMTVEQLMIGKDIYTVSGSGYEPKGRVLLEGQPITAQRLKDLELFFVTGIFASNAHVSPPDNQHATWHCLGDPTEGAMITLAGKTSIQATGLDQNCPELKEFAFDSARKRMSSIRRYGPHNQLYVFVKGAPESVLERCRDIWDHGHVRSLKVADQANILKQHTSWANQANRNLAYAYKVLSANTDINKLEMDSVEDHLTFLGLVSMVDPLRQEVPQAMQDTHQAHIQVSIITGDFALTAQAIASKAGLAQNPQELVLVSGDQLHKMSDDEILDKVSRGGTIFSRVSPEDKLHIVELIKNSGQVVAVTGDGINDAPALKRADIGVAMGKTGTDVAKQSAEIVLLDDSFHTLVGAIKEGRVIFQNIKKGALSCFTSNSAELVINLTSLAAMTIFGVPLALSVMEILAIDLLAELFPIAALGWDTGYGELMNEKPRDLRHHILNANSLIDLLWCGLLIGSFAFMNFLFFFARHGISFHDIKLTDPVYMKATAMTYVTVVICQLLNILQRRSPRGLFTRYQFHNKTLGIALLISLFCVVMILYNPVVAPYFGAGPLGLTDWLFALGAGALFVLIREIQRLLLHRTRSLPKPARLSSVISS